MPSISIITATHERPAELKEALESALAQGFADFEHLVVDDASKSGATAAVIEGLADPRIRLIRLDESRGPAGARNAGIAEAKGELLAILDDDDLMLPGRLQAAADAFAADPELVLFASAFEAIDLDGTVHATVHPPTDEKVLAELLPDHNPVCHSTCTVRTDVMRSIGGYREILRYSHDYDMVLRVAERGRIAIDPRALGRYRFHAQNISTARCFLQGAYARIVQRCARRRARGDAEELEQLIAAVDLPSGEADVERARARVEYQIGEWKFKDGKVKEARPHLRESLKAEPFRPLAVGLTVAAYTPAPIRRLLGPVVRPLVARRYASWR